MPDNLCVARAPRFNDPQGEPNNYSDKACLVRTRGGHGKAGPSMSSHETLETSLQILEAEGIQFARMLSKDAAVREAYVETIREMSREIRKSVLEGDLTPEQGARFASEQRNVILEASRMKSSDLGRSVAESLKGEGLKFDDLTEKYASKRFSKSFKELSPLEQEEVFIDILESAGRDRPKFTAATKNLSRLSKGLWVLSGGIAIYNIATAEDKGEAVVEEGVSAGGGLLGGAAGGLAVTPICGPGAPFCAAAVIAVGTLIGSFGAGLLYDSAKDAQESKDQGKVGTSGGGGSR